MKHAKNYHVSIFLTMKATLLDTHWQSIWNIWMSPFNEHDNEHSRIRPKMFVITAIR